MSIQIAKVKYVALSGTYKSYLKLTVRKRRQTEKIVQDYEARADYKLLVYGRYTGAHKRIPRFKAAGRLPLKA